MAIRTVVTRGYGNGTFNGTIPLVTLRGYAAGAVSIPTLPGLEWSAPDDISRGWSAPDSIVDGWAAKGKCDWSAPVED